METLDYLSVLLSIVLGLAIAQVLQGFRGIILSRATVALHFPTLIWAGLALLMAIQGWWASFGLHLYTNGDFMAFLVIILHAISVYIVAALVLPDIAGEAVDLRDHYFAHKGWIFGAFLASIGLSMAKDLTLYGHLPGRISRDLRLGGDRGHGHSPRMVPQPAGADCRHLVPALHRAAFRAAVESVAPH